MDARPHFYQPVALDESDASTNISNVFDASDGDSSESSSEGPDSDNDKDSDDDALIFGEEEELPLEHCKAEANGLDVSRTSVSTEMVWPLDSED